MQQTNQPTVQSRSWLRAVLKWLLLACLIFSGVVGAAYWLIHTTIVPRVDDWRARIEVKLSDSLGLPVHIGGIEGDSQNGTTHLRVKGIRIDGARSTKAPLRPPRTLQQLGANGYGPHESSQRTWQRTQYRFSF